MMDDKELNRFPYVYSWGPRLLGFNRKGQFFRVLVHGPVSKMKGGAGNSALIEFEDGFKAVISRNAIRTRKHGPKEQ